MGIFYRIMGVIAVASERMARQRVNAIPLNWWIMLGVGVFTFAAAMALRESLRNRRAAPDVTVGQAVADAYLTDSYVRVIQPQLAFEQSLSEGEEGASADDKDKPFWVPMLDPSGKHAMYVQLTYGVDEADTTGGIRGMVRPLKRELKDHVAAKGIKVEGVPMDTRVMLVAGERPARLWLWATLASIGAGVILLMLLAFALRYVVFRRGRTPVLNADTPPPLVDPAAVDLRVSGKFRLHEKARQRFLDTPAVVAEMESGDRGLLANVNASVSMYGQVTENRAGVWGILIKSGTLQPPQYGTMYAGWRPRPAMRLRFTDAATNARASAVLTFATPEGRDAVRAALYAPPGQAVSDLLGEEGGATEDTEDTEEDGTAA